MRPDDLIRFRDSTAKILSTASANMDLKVVRVCFNAAQKQDLVDSNVAAKVSTIKKRGENKRRAFTLEEVKDVLEKCDKAGGEWRGLVLVAVYTGQRLGDISRLTWQQVDLEKQAISFVTQKNWSSVLPPQPAPHRSSEYLSDQPSTDDPKAYIFPKAAAMAEKHTGTISTKFYDEILAPIGLVEVRPKAKAAENGQGRSARRTQSQLTFHSFRHTLTTWLKSSRSEQCLGTNDHRP